jgi:hypothetical protein
MLESVEPKDKSFEERIARLHLIGDTLPIALFGVSNVVMAALRASNQQGHDPWTFFSFILLTVVFITFAFVRLQNDLAKLSEHLVGKTSKRLRATAGSLALAANVGIMIALSSS